MTSVSSVPPARGAAATPAGMPIATATAIAATASSTVAGK